MLSRLSSGNHRRLLAERVDGAGDQVYARRVGQRRFVHRHATGRVDQIGRRLHHRERDRIDMRFLA